RGIVHRDLKPSNIMLGRHGETVIVDWGLAKAIHVTEKIEGGATPSAEFTFVSVKDSDLTLPGSMVGTPAFMSPEQAAGRLDATGPVRDIYNLGATLYHLLTGRPPFENEEPALIRAKIQRGLIPPPRDVAAVRIPRPLEAICLKSMALLPKDRYRSARALAED